jgi:hypothetical protein
MFVTNDILQVFVEGGVLGVLLFSSLLGFVFYTGIKKFKSLHVERHAERLILFSMGGIATIIVCGLFSYPLMVLPIYLIFWILIALISNFVSDYTFVVKLNFPLSLITTSVVITIGFLCTGFGYKQFGALYEWQSYKDDYENGNLNGSYSTHLKKDP